MERVDEVRRENRSFGRVEPVDSVDKLLLGSIARADLIFQKLETSVELCPVGTLMFLATWTQQWKMLTPSPKTSEMARLWAK